MNVTTIIKTIKDNKYTVIAIIAILFLVHMFMKKEAFTPWDASFSCDLGNIELNGVTSDAGPIKTTYIEGEDILTSYFHQTAFNAEASE